MKIEKAFCVIRNGASIKQFEGAGGIPITRIETIANRYVDRNKMGYANIEDSGKYDSYVLQDGDILMSHINSVQHLGKTAIYHSLPDEKIIHGMNLLGLRANREVINPGYANYFFNSPAFLLQLPRITKKSVNQASFTVTELKQLNISCPSLEKQQQIVDVLSKVDQIIELRKRQILNLDELIKSRFIEMFGDPKNKKENLVKIEDIGELTSGGTPSRTKPEYFQGNIRWYNAGELNTLYLKDSIEHITETAIRKSSAKIFKKGTLMIGMYDTAAFKMGILTEDSSANQACANLNPHSGYDVIWLYYLFDIMKPVFLKERQGVRQKNLSLSKIKQFMIPSARFDLQSEFADFVKATDKSKMAVQKSLDKLEILKKSLMQQYFS